MKRTCPVAVGFENVGACLAHALDLVSVTEGADKRRPYRWATRTSLAQRNLRALTARLRANGARLVFATTTPVPTKIASGPRRRSADVLERNEIAHRVMSELGVPVNDLYAVAFDRLAEIQREANVHFTDEGSRVLAAQVAGAIRSQLNK